MRTYDITLSVSADMPVWPGDAPTELIRNKSESGGGVVNISRLSMSAHAGTHVDAPDHFLDNGRTIEHLSLEVLVGRAYVLHLPEGNLITAAMLEKSDIPPRTRRILFKTRNSEFWVRKERVFQTDYTALSADAAELLVERNVKLVGIDYLSIAPYKQGRPVHETFLKAGVVIVEGLDLSQVSQGRYTLHCLPLKLAGSDGAPARAILVGV